MVRSAEEKGPREGEGPLSLRPLCKTCGAALAKHVSA